MKKIKVEEATVDMTPMIDCVFLLIIFFMIVSEISQIDLEFLVLPVADEAVPDEKPARDRLIINVVKKGGIASSDRAGLYKMKGKEVAAPDLVNALKREAQLDWDDKKKMSNRFVLIRCDKDVTYSYVQDIMMMCCTNEKIRIVKIQIAIKKDGA
jgi:biopolymer transport protein ExbD